VHIYASLYNATYTTRNSVCSYRSGNTKSIDVSVEECTSETLVSFDKSTVHHTLEERARFFVFLVVFHIQFTKIFLFYFWQDKEIYKKICFNVTELLCTLLARFRILISPPYSTHVWTRTEAMILLHPPYRGILALHHGRFRRAFSLLLFEN
jgi:hypothetical protein